MPVGRGEPARLLVALGWPAMLMPSLMCSIFTRVGLALISAAVAVPVTSSNASEDQKTSTSACT